MCRKLFCVLLALLMLPALSLGEGKRVYLAGETAPFGADEKLLTLRVCPLVGADSMLLTLDGEHSMLIDMARKVQADDVLSMLSGAGLDRVDFAFNTHPHEDHLGGLPPLLKKIGMGAFMTAFPLDYTAACTRQLSAVRALREADVPIHTVQDGDLLEFGGARIEVLQQTRFFTPNDASAMLHITYGECSILLTADVEGPGQDLLLERGVPRADVMKMPHHGLNAVRDEFLAAVAPELTFIPHGSLNSQQVQRQLRDAGVPVLFASWGPITLSTNGERWIVLQEIFEDMQRHAATYRLE